MVLDKKYTYTLIKKKLKLTSSKCTHPQNTMREQLRLKSPTEKTVDMPYSQYILALTLVVECLQAKLI